MAATSLYNHPKYQACVSHAAKWIAENSIHYCELLCLKAIESSRGDEIILTAYDKLKEKMSDTYEDIQSKKQNFLCTLPISHSGKCTYTPHKRFITNSVISGKLDWIYSTPGDDDYIYKNRSHRLFPIVVPDDVEKQWRDKTVKLKCAIPLREASTPLLMAAAYLDYLSLIFRVHGIQEHIDTTYVHMNDIQATVDIHAAYLEGYYGTFNRRIFDSDGFSICPVTTERIEISHLANNDIKDDNSIQLGHVVPRSETEFTIRGKNILLMSREGNRIVGDNVFTEDVWLNRLKRIIEGHSAESSRNRSPPSQ